MSDYEVKQIPLAEIEVPANRIIQADPEAVAWLKKSMEDGSILINPILLRTRKAKGKFKYVLVAGANRLQAFREMKRPTIPASVHEMSDEEAKLLEIIENLARKHLTKLQQSELMKLYRVIYESRHPETKPPTPAERGKKGAEKRHGKKQAKQEPIANAESAVATPPPFVQEMAERLHRSPRAIEIGLQIAEKLTLKTKKLIEETPIANRATDLLTLSRIDKPERQLQTAEEMVADEQRRTELAAEEKQQRHGMDPMCVECFNLRKQKLPPEAKGAGYKSLLKCAAGKFEDCEEHGLPVSWNPWNDPCPDFDGDLRKAQKRAEKSRPKQKIEKKGSNYVNLANALPESITIKCPKCDTTYFFNPLDEIDKYVKSPNPHLFLPSKEKRDRQAAEAELITLTFKDTGSRNKTAELLGMNRGKVRDVVGKAEKGKD